MVADASRSSTRPTGPPAGYSVIVMKTENGSSA